MLPLPKAALSSSNFNFNRILFFSLSETSFQVVTILKYLWQRSRTQAKSLELEVWHDLAYVYISLSQWRDAEICLSKSEVICYYSADRSHATGISMSSLFFLFLNQFLDSLGCHFWLKFWYWCNFPCSHNCQFTKLTSALPKALKIWFCWLFLVEKQGRNMFMKKGFSWMQLLLVNLVLGIDLEASY